MANRAAAIYIRSNDGYTVPPKKMVNLPVGQNYYIFWYEGSCKRARSVGRQAEVAQIALTNKQRDLKVAAITGVTIAQPDAEKSTSTKLMTVTEAVKKFLAHTEVRVGDAGYGASIHTLQAYTRRLDRLTAFEAKADTNTITLIADVDEQYLDRFLAFLRTLKIGDRYVYNILQTTITLLRRFDVKVSRRVMSEAGMGEPLIVKAYTKDQLDGFFAKCTAQEELIFKFFMFSLCRELEVANTEVGDLLFEESVLHIQSKPHRHFRLKGKKSGQAARGRKVPMPRKFMDQLRKYTKGMQSRDLLFPNTEGGREGHFHRHCTEIAFRAGVNCKQCRGKHTVYFEQDGKRQKKIVEHSCATGPYCGEFNLHKFRKTGAAQHYKDGVPVPVIQRWLGHEDIATTMDYLDISDTASEHYVDRVSNGTLAARA